MADFAADYVDVNERIRLFLEQYPEGSLQFDYRGPVEFADLTLIHGVAYAYRHPGDPRPGIGHAWEQVPGRTPYTRGSELMNLETSAWGRAIAALGIGLRKGIASKQEVTTAKERAHEFDKAMDIKHPEAVLGRSPKAGTGPATDKQIGMIKALLPLDQVDAWKRKAGINAKLTKQQASDLITLAKEWEGAGAPAPFIDWCDKHLDWRAEPETAEVLPPWE